MKKIILTFLIVLPYLTIHAQGINTLVTKAELDSALATFYTYTDTKQMVVKSDTLTLSDTLSGQASFTSTDSADTVVVTGVDSSDVVVASPRESRYNVNDILFVYVKTNEIIVVRNSTGGTSGLKWNYVWVRKYP